MDGYNIDLLERILNIDLESIDALIGAENDIYGPEELEELHELIEIGFKLNEEGLLDEYSLSVYKFILNNTDITQHEKRVFHSLLVRSVFNIVNKGLNGHK
jgi:hypothetical protein